MTDPIREFELECERAGVAPSAALKAGALNPKTWFRWKSGAVSPTLRSFEAARRGLETLKLAANEADAGAEVSLAKPGAVQ